MVTFSWVQEQQNHFFFFLFFNNSVTDSVLQWGDTQFVHEWLVRKFPCPNWKKTNPLTDKSVFICWHIHNRSTDFLVAMTTCYCREQITMQEPPRKALCWHNDTRFCIDALVFVVIHTAKDSSQNKLKRMEFKNLWKDLS